MGKPSKITKTAKEMGPAKGQMPGMPKGGKKPGLMIMIGLGKPKKDGKR